MSATNEHQEQWPLKLANVLFKTGLFYWITLLPVAFKTLCVQQNLLYG
jgi:hypothetical protein